MSTKRTNPGRKTDHFPNLYHLTRRISRRSAIRAPRSVPLGQFSVSQEPIRASLPSLSSHDGTRAAHLSLPGNASERALDCEVLKCLSLRGFPHSANWIGLTKRDSKGYRIKLNSALYGCCPVAEAESSVPGTLNIRGRSPVLTPFREGQSRDSWHVACGLFTDHRGFAFLTAGCVRVRSAPIHLTSDFPDGLPGAKSDFANASRARRGA